MYRAQQSHIGGVISRVGLGFELNRPDFSQLTAKNLWNYVRGIHVPAYLEPAPTAANNAIET